MPQRRAPTSISTSTSRVDAGLGGGRLHLGDVVGIVDAHADLGAARQRRQPVELGRARHLVGDQHVADAALHQHLGFRHLLAAHADRAEFHLPGRDDGRLVRLGMRTQPHAGLADEVRHAPQVALEGVEIDDQRRRVDVGERHADGGGRFQGHGNGSYAGNPAARVYLLTL